MNSGFQSRMACSSSCSVADVLDGVLHPALQLEREEKRRLQRRQRQAVHLRAEAEQPFAQPRALEAGVAR